MPDFTVVETGMEASLRRYRATGEVFSEGNGMLSWCDAVWGWGRGRAGIRRRCFEEGVSGERNREVKRSRLCHRTSNRYIIEVSCRRLAIDT